MNTGKTLFAQLMDFLPWTTFTRIVDRYGGDHRVRTLSCAEQYRSMAFAQLTCRESLRDIETCLSVHASKLYHMGFRQPVRRSTLADANERRDWRIHAALAQRLITQARTLYVDEELGLDLTNTVYALDSTTIALCLSVFPWAHFPHHQGGGEDAHAARPAGQHSEFYPHLGWQAARRSCPRYALAGSRSHLRRGSWLRRLCPPFMCCTKPGPSSSRVPSRTSMLIASIRRRRIARPASFATRPSPWTASTPVRTTPNFCGASASRTPSSARRWSSSPTTSRFRPPPSARSTKAAGRWKLFFKWIKQHLRIKQFYGTSENAVKTQIWIAVSVYVLVAIVKKRLDLDASLYTLLQILSVTLFEKMPIHQALAGDENRCNASQITNQLNLFDF